MNEEDVLVRSISPLLAEDDSRGCAEVEVALEDSRGSAEIPGRTSGWRC
jgi:hypothetical protein